MDNRNEGFAIVCTARCGHSLGVHTLALVDRAKSKSRWWTSDDASVAICYRNRSAADFAAKRLRHNAARVVPFAAAASTLQVQSEQISEIEFQHALSDAERGWDSHKEG